jgi:hypothetical protein
VEGFVYEASLVVLARRLKLVVNATDQYWKYVVTRRIGKPNFLFLGN